MSRKIDAEPMKYGDKVHRVDEARDMHMADAHLYSSGLTTIVGDRYRVLLMAGVPRVEAWERANQNIPPRRPLIGCSCQ